MTGAVSMTTEDYSRSRLLGYPSRLSARHGEKITFFVSAPTGAFTAEVRRLTSIDDRDGAGGIRHELVPSRLEPSYAGAEQRSAIGNYAEFTDSGLPGRGLPLFLAFSFQPTLLPGANEVLVSFNGDDDATAVSVSEGKLTLAIDGLPAARLDLGLVTHVWYRAALAVGGGSAKLSATRLSALGKAEGIEETIVQIRDGTFLPRRHAGHVTFAALKSGPAARDHFTGKLGDVAFAGGAVTDEEIGRILNGAEAGQVLGSRVTSSWSMGRNTAPMAIPNDVSGAPALKLVNLPLRAVTGSRWSGRRHHPELAPDEYNAVLFHGDMVEGGDWKPSLDLAIAPEWRSGVYALRIQDGTDEDWIPFYVRPAAGAKHAKVLFLAPTNTYLAYGNETNSTADIGDELMLMKTEAVGPQDADKYAAAHPELGLSIYDNHTDGAGICYASRLRPLLNFRPFHFNWLNNSYRHFAADFYLLDWLEHYNFDYDVLTDEDLHFEGLNALKRYEVVITGSHPEYVSERMMNAVQEYVDGGGNLMYLGGNGFYWATSFHPDLPHVIEVRRGYTGARNWTSPPGETVHASTGEQGGIWRNRGRSPHRLTGIGMGAVGWGKAAPYHVAREGRTPKHDWIFEGVSEDLIGTEGMMLGGAAGDEIDHVDHLHGTPPETDVIASSVGLTEHFQPVIEYYTNILPGQGGSKNPLVRADMTWLTTKGGGSVFSVGSICWVGCLPINDYANAASRVTLNVLNRFVGNR